MPPGFARDIRRTLLKGSAITVSTFSYGAITLCGAAFQPTSDPWTWVCAGLQLHISLPFRGGIRFALYRVRSPLMTVSLLISFPAGTKMLQSPAFPVATDHSEE